MQFIAITADDRDFVVVVNEEDDSESILDWVAECFYMDTQELKIGRRTVTCDHVVRALGLMHFDVLEVRDEPELVEDSF